MEDYEKQAIDFAKKFGVKLEQVGNPEYRSYFVDDKERRYVFKMELTREKKTYTFTFGQSIAGGAKTPTMYDVLASLTNYDPESFEDFCGNYGYDENSRKAEKIYKAVVKEWENVERLFSDCLDELREIQ